MIFAPKRLIRVPSRTSKITIWNIADIHLGSACCDEERLGRVIAAIKKDPLSFYVLCGDMCECIVPQDSKRWDIRSVAPWVLDWNDGEGRRTPAQAQMERLHELFRPIAWKCLGVVNGNHEEALTTHYAQSTGAWLAGQLKAPFLDACGVIPLSIVRVRCNGGFNMVILADHGHSAASTPGGRASMLQRSMDRWTGVDVCFMGHLHSQDTVVTERIGFNNAMDSTRMERTVGILSGAFLRTYVSGVPSYGERKGYRPSVLGPLAVEVGLQCAPMGYHERLTIRAVEPEY